MVQNPSKILFSGTIPASLFSIELVKMPIWVHGTPLPMTGPATDEPTGARLSRVRPGVHYVPNGGLSYGTYSPEHQFFISGELLFNDARILRWLKNNKNGKIT